MNFSCRQPRTIVPAEMALSGVIDGRVPNETLWLNKPSIGLTRFHHHFETHTRSVLHPVGILDMTHG